MDIDAGLRIRSQKIRRLAPLLREWATAVQKLSTTWGDYDAPYFYNERANISLLAAGAWLKGWQALEEYSDQKQHPTVRSSQIKVRSEKSSGRVDLYVTSGRWDIIFEAKHKWMNARTKLAPFKGKISSAIKLATEDAKRDYGAQATMGCVFFVPKFPASHFKRAEMNSHIDREILRYLSFTRMAAWAWCFPPESRLHLIEAENAYYPGVVMGVQSAKLWKK